MKNIAHYETHVAAPGQNHYAQFHVTRSKVCQVIEEKSCGLLLMSIRVMLLALTLDGHFRRLVGFPFLHLSRSTSIMRCV
jgi:hypothetical protein